MRGLHTPITSNASFWVGPGRRARKKIPLRYAAARPASGAQAGSPMDALGARGASMKDIFGAGDEDAGAAGLAPDALVAGSGRTVVVVAWHELLLVDPQFAIEEMQLFDARMRMRRVTGAGRQAHQHADPVPYHVGREQLAFDPGRDLLPFRLGPSLLARAHRRQHRFFPGLLGDATRQARLQRCGRTQHID